MSTTATLDGKTLFGEVAWKLASGARPVLQTFSVMHEDAKTLLEGKLKPITLEMKSDDAGGKFENLFVIQRVASPNPAYSTILVADRRWFWTYQHFRGVYNLRRRIGVKRLESATVLADEAKLIVPDFMYVPFSLKNGAVYTAGDVLDELLKEASNAEELGGGGGFKATVAWGGENVPVESLELDASVADCIEQIMGYLPGAAITVMPTGAIKVYDKTGGDNDILNHFGPEIIGAGHIETCDMARVRPRQIDVLFTIEAEVRLNFTEQDSSSTSAIDETAEGRNLFNVLDAPDYVIPNVSPPVVMGTWISFPRALSDWGVLPGFGAKLSFPAIRACMVPFMDLWNLVALSGSYDPNVSWMGRIAKVQQHYRTTFQVARKFMDRVMQLRPYRVALANTATGTRGPIGVWSDYAYMPTQRSFLAEKTKAPMDSSFVMNVACYPTDGLLASATTSSAATCDIVDDEQGILSLDYLADKWRQFEQALPSQVEFHGDNTQPGNKTANPGPSSYLGKANTNGIAFNCLLEGARIPVLTANHKVSIVLTAVPGAPNSKKALFKVTIEPGQVKSFPGQKNCLGPILEYRIAPSLETAKVAWKDDRAEDIERLFGFSGNAQFVGEQPDIKELVINKSPGIAADDTVGGSLDKIAVAAATRIWHALRDRPQGEAASGYTPSLQLTGWADEIGHAIDGGSGAVTTSVSFPPHIEPLRLENYLDASTRRILMRIVNPEK